MPRPKTDDPITDLSGRKFGRRRVIQFAGWNVVYPPSRPRGVRHSQWEARCECGTVQTVALSQLRVCESCGCLGRELTSEAKRTAPEIEARVVAAYTGEPSATVAGVAERLGVPESTTALILRRHNVTIRPQRAGLRYDVNEDYFASIDTEEKAYWLGFIAADGCITRGVFKIGLAERDSGHLEALRAAIGYTGTIDHRMQGGGPGQRTKRRGVALLCISRKQFAAHLVEQGIAERKTWTLGPPSKVPAVLLRHYYRGLFDGDGWISKGCNTRRSGDVWEIGLCGTRAICEAFAEFVTREVVVPLSLRPHGTIFKVTSGGVEYPRAVAHLLYDAARVCLPRKEARVRELLAAHSVRTRFVHTAAGPASKSDAPRLTGTAKGTFYNRLKRGMSELEAMTTPNLNPGRLITHDGETRSLAEWARRTGLNRHTIAARLAKGDTPERAFRPL